MKGRAASAVYVQAERLHADDPAHTQEDRPMPRQNKAERQARLATPAPDATAKPPTRDELYQLAKAAGIKGASKFNREQLAAALEQHTNGQVKEALAAEAPSPAEDEPDLSTMQGRQQLGDKRVSEAAQHYADTLNDPEAPKAEEDPAKRTIAAKEEQALLKQWQIGGMKGERPVTPNYDFIAAQYVAGGAGLMPKAKRARAASGGGGGTRARGDIGPRGKAGLAEKARIKGKRGEVAKEDKATMEAYIVQMHAEHPDSTALDEFRYAYWVDKRGFGKKSFLDKWAELFPEGGATPADADLDTEADTDLPPADDTDVQAQVHAAAKAVAKKATTKKAPAKKAPAKKATSKTKDVTPNFKTSTKK